MCVFNFLVLGSLLPDKGPNLKRLNIKEKMFYFLPILDPKDLSLLMKSKSMFIFEYDLTVFDTLF